MPGTCTEPANSGSETGSVVQNRARLSPKQRRFVAEYLIDLNASKAAERAGYSRKTARSQGQRLLTNVDIQTEIQNAATNITKKSEMTAEAVLERLWGIIDSDPGDFFNEDGTLKDVKQLTERQRKAISSYEIVRRNPESGDNATEYVHKVKYLDKIRAVELAAKVLGLIRKTSGPPAGGIHHIFEVVYENPDGTRSYLDSNGQWGLPEKAATPVSATGTGGAPCD